MGDESGEAGSGRRGCFERVKGGFLYHLGLIIFFFRSVSPSGPKGVCQGGVGRESGAFCFWLAGACWVKGLGFGGVQSRRS